MIEIKFLKIFFKKPQKKAKMCGGENTNVYKKIHKMHQNIPGDVKYARKCVICAHPIDKMKFCDIINLSRISSRQIYK